MLNVTCFYFPQVIHSIQKRLSAQAETHFVVSIYALSIHASLLRYFPGSCRNSSENDMQVLNVMASKTLMLVVNRQIRLLLVLIEIFALKNIIFDFETR